MSSREALLPYLLKNYNKDSSLIEHREVFSSQWLGLIDRAKVKLDAEGKIISLSADGTGLETFERHNLIDRLLDGACILSHLTHLSRRLDLVRVSLEAQRLCRRMGRRFTLDVFRQVSTVEFLKRNLTPLLQGRRLQVLVIGDGYGIFGALWKRLFPDTALVTVDLGKVLIFQAHYFQKTHPDSRHELIHAVESLEQADFVYCPAEEMDELYRFRYDVAVNIVSMHEMNPETIRRYFCLLRARLQPDNLFYCCNREYKRLVGGEETHFSDYPWEKEDRILIDEFCPWHQYFFSRYRISDRPRLWGWKIPWVNFYEYRELSRGRIRHRLTIIHRPCSAGPDPMSV